jgi:hypothetical protein
MAEAELHATAHEEDEHGEHDQEEEVRGTLLARMASGGAQPLAEERRDVRVEAGKTRSAVDRVVLA